MGEGVGLVDHHVLVAAVAQGVTLLDGVEPPDHALAAGAGAEFEQLEFRGQRMRVVHAREKGVGAHLGVVGLAHAEGVNALQPARPRSRRTPG